MTLDAEEPRDRAADRSRFEEYRETRDHELRNALVLDNIGLAETIGRRYRGRGESDEDLRQVALLGLVKAVERFDPAHNTAFSTFAMPTIDGELKRHFRDQRWSVRVPRSVQEHLLAVNHAVAELTHRHGRSPTVAEVAGMTGLDEEMVLEAFDAAGASRVVSIDAPVGDEPVVVPAEPDAAFDTVEHRLLVARLLEGCTERERSIVMLRFYDGLTQSEIAARFGISQMQVSRILSRVLAVLRARTGLEG
jgi:RNA polymerase sigma-B factor